jgi:hypothetical protein
MFFLPNFDLVCNIWRNATLITAPPDLSPACQLRVFKSGFFGIAGVNAGAMLLCLLAGTDIRPQGCATFHDQLEVPALTGRFYNCIAVDDVGRGFPNQYRIALIEPNYAIWTLPIA